MTYTRSRYKLICLILFASIALSCDDESNKAGADTPKHASSSPMPSPKQALPGGPAGCPEGIHPRMRGRVEEKHLQEISGLVASRTANDLLWVHNDSGDQARIYAMTGSGAPLGSLEIARVARDFEDIALEHRENAPDRIYIADTGDNLGQRKEGVFIHRFEEPSLEAIRSVHPWPLRIDDTETMRVRFPEGPVDAEALIVDPESGRLVLVTKPRLALPEVYEVEVFSEEAVLHHVGTVTARANGSPLHLVTAADLSPDGRYVVLRTYDTIVVFIRKSGQSVAQALLSEGCVIKPAHENQGEAVGFLGPESPGTEEVGGFPRFLTVGEGISQPIYSYEKISRAGKQGGSHGRTKGAKHSARPFPSRASARPYQLSI